MTLLHRPKTNEEPGSGPIGFNLNCRGDNFISGDGIERDKKFSGLIPCLILEMIEATKILFLPRYHQTLTFQMKSRDLKVQAVKLYHEKRNFAEVARVFGICEKSVRNWVRNGVESTQKSGETRGRKKILSRSEVTRVKRQTRRLAANRERVTARKVQENCDISHVSLRTVQRTLSSLRFKYLKPSKKIVLSSKHRRKRLDLASQWVIGNHDWSRTIFTDEKRFCLDGPDG